MHRDQPVSVLLVPPDPKECKVTKGSLVQPELVALDRRDLRE